MALLMHRDVVITTEGIVIADTPRNRLKEARVSVADVAKALGVTRRAVDYKLNGSLRLDADEVNAINRLAGRDCFTGLRDWRDCMRDKDMFFPFQTGPDGRLFIEVSGGKIKFNKQGGKKL